MERPVWGTKSFTRGFELPEAKTLRELASRSRDDLLHVINLLHRNGSEEAIEMAEEFFDMYA